MTTIGGSNDAEGWRDLLASLGHGSLAPSPKPEPAVSRYDVDTWEVLEYRGDTYRWVANGRKEAEITNEPGGKTVDLHVPWTQYEILDVADRVEALAWGCSEFSVHVDVTRAQREGHVRIEMAGVDAVSLRLDEGQPVEALSRLALGLQSLEGVVAMALLGCALSEGDFSERQVQEVDGRAEGLGLRGAVRGVADAVRLGLGNLVGEGIDVGTRDVAD